jgi:hypothetical protein
MAKKKKEDFIKSGKNTQFGAPGGNDPRRGGRKKKLKNVLKHEGYATDDIRRATLILASMNESDLDLIVKDKSRPSIFRIAGGAFLRALKKPGADLRLVKELIDLSGATQKNEDSGPVEIIIKRETPNG